MPSFCCHVHYPDPASRRSDGRAYVCNKSTIVFVNPTVERIKYWWGFCVFFFPSWCRDKARQGECGRSPPKLISYYRFLCLLPFFFFFQSSFTLPRHTPLLHHSSPHPSLPVIPRSLCPIHAIMRQMDDVSAAVALITVIAWRALLCSGSGRQTDFFFCSLRCWWPVSLCLPGCFPLLLSLCVCSAVCCFIAGVMRLAPPRAPDNSMPPLLLSLLAVA